jgi:hypothetical protein
MYGELIDVVVFRTLYNYTVSELIDSALFSALYLGNNLKMLSIVAIRPTPGRPR